MKAATTIISLLLCGTLLTACEQAASPEKPAAAQKTAAEQTTPSPAVNPDTLYPNIWQAGDKAMQQSEQSAQALFQSVEKFLADSDHSHWQALQQQWLSSHAHWHQAETYLQWLSPNYELSQLRLRIHSLEITPGYLDSIEGYPQSGIVNDSTLAIEQQSIIEQHRRYSDEETALGIHVLEFFIWGRPLQDYLPSQDPANAKAISRRRQYLKLLAYQWLSDIKTAQAFWQQRQEQLVAPAALTLTMQQQLGALADNHHCQFSQDDSWRRAVINSIGQHITSHNSLTQLQQSSVSDESFKPLIGELMLALRLKAS